ncbi:MAG TPA: hypothetical protein DEF45_18720 [Rhodopirellula sp.]|nr:hypothetical protein [Rhodopirellula sp.]
MERFLAELFFVLLSVGKRTCAVAILPRSVRNCGQPLDDGTPPGFVFPTPKRWLEGWIAKSAILKVGPKRLLQLLI